MGHFGVNLEIRFASEDGLGYLLGYCGATLKSPLGSIPGSIGTQYQIIATVKFAELIGSGYYHAWAQGPANLNEHP